MTAQVKVSAVVRPVDLPPAKWKQILYVAGLLRVMRKLLMVNATAGDKVEILFNNPSAITDITADNRETLLSVSNRTITILNSTPESVRVYDLSGREILATSSAVFTIPESAGHNVVLNIVTESGNISAHKLSLR